MATTTTKTKKKATVESSKTRTVDHVEVLARLNHVQARKSLSSPLRIQATTDYGRVVLPEVTENIYRAVLGEARGENKTSFSLGLRKLSGCKFRALYDENGVVFAMDIIPARYFSSGVAPTVSRENRAKGFEVVYREDINGYEVFCEDDKGAKRRITYNGMTEVLLSELLDALRAFDWTGRQSATMCKHRVEKLDSVTFRVRPTSSE